MSSLLIRFNQWLAGLEKILVSLITGALTLILMTQVILRYGFSRPLFWAEEICVQFLVFITLIGLSLLINQKQMIAVDFVAGVFPQKIRKLISGLIQVLGLVVVAFYAYHSTLWILRPEVRLELSPTTQLPIWLNYMVLPLSLYAMIYHMFIACLKGLLKTDS